MSRYVAFGLGRIALGSGLAAAVMLMPAIGRTQWPPPSDSRQPSPLQPGALLSFEFPQLPKTLAGETASLHVRLPDSYDPKRKYPIFLWVGGGNGGRGNPRTDMVDPDKYVCIGLPLFKEVNRKKGSTISSLHLHYDDARVLWEAWSSMLDRLEKEIPNLELGRGVAAGFSNGAHAIGLLLNEKPREIRRWFSAFVFVEGGYLLKSTLGTRNCAVLVVAGETSWLRRDMSSDGSPPADAQDFARRHRADLIVMKGVGHDFPPEYVTQVREWLAKKGF